MNSPLIEEGQSAISLFCYGGRSGWRTTGHPRNTLVGPFAAISAVANSLGMSTRIVL